MVKTCSKCKAEKDISNFRKKTTTTYRSWCVDCKREYDRVWKKNLFATDDNALKMHLERNAKQREVKTNIIKEYLALHPCLKCGETNVNILDFDHRSTEEKDRPVSDMLSQGRGKLLAEIDKCDVLCGNCHMHKTQHQLNTWKAKYCEDAKCPWHEQYGN